MPAGTKVADGEKKLRAQAQKQGLKGKDADSFVYGILNKDGIMRGNKPTKRGLRKAGSK